jgi:hypothetical protein
MQLSLGLDAPTLRERAPDEPPPVVIRGMQRDQVVMVDGIRHEVRGVDEDGPCWCPVGMPTVGNFRALLWEEVEEIAPGRWRTLTPAAPVVASVMEGVA